MKKLPYYDFPGNVIIRLLVGLIFILVYGAGKFSADSKLFSN